MTELVDTPAVPVPRALRKQFGARIDEGLLAAVQDEQKRRNITFRQVIEWSFSVFLLQSNPGLAAKLGIYKG